MASFPALQSGQVTMTPMVRERRYRTEVVEFCDGSTQRWAGQDGLHAFQLACQNLDGYDLANIVEFFRSMKGKFDTWDLTIEGVTHPNLAFDQDELPATEGKPNRQSLALRVIQVRKA